MIKLSLQPITIVCGHYGSGKTNLTVNLALRAALEGGPVTVIDMDIVNPYFRTADFERLFSEKGVRLIAPLFANTNLDVPVLPPSVGGVLRAPVGSVFLDVGGDEDGAVALGGYSALLEAAGYSMLYVLNSRRELEPDPAAEAELLGRIQRCSRLKVTHLVNNTNLGCETTPKVVTDSRQYAEEVSRLTGIPILCTAINRQYAKEFPEKMILPIEVYVKPPWDE